MIYRTKAVALLSALLGCSSEASFEASGDAGLDSGLGQGETAEDAGADAGMDAAVGLDSGASAGGLGDAGAADAGTADAGASDAGPVTDAAIASVTAFTNDFEGTLPTSIDPGAGTLTPTQTFAAYGPVGNQFGAFFLRSATANVVTLTLNDLPPHSSLSIDLLFAAIDSLDGEGQFPADDFFRVTLDGLTIFRESFANATDTQIQSYDPPPNVVLARRIDLGFNGPGSFYTDSAYDFSQDPAFDHWPHSSSTAVITFTLEGTGVQDINDESWAIDNVRVTLGDTLRELPDAGLDAAVTTNP